MPNNPGLFDLFISYCHHDKNRVWPLVEVIKKRGLRVWIDEGEIQDFESITAAITQGLANTKALLVWYSADYPKSRACQWELTAAFIAAQQAGDPRQRILVINPETDNGHLHPVELRDQEYQKPPALEDLVAWEALVDKIVNHVRSLPNVFRAIRSLTPPPWYGYRGLGSNRFVGRLPELWYIHSGLHASKAPVITHAIGGGLVQLYGTGGMGKSLLAEEYALRFGAAYPGGVFWLRAFGHTDVRPALGAEERENERQRQIRTFAEFLGLLVKDRNPAEIEGHLGRELGYRGEPFLWFVDDLPSGLAANTLRSWLAPHPLGKTLITTRSQEYEALGAPIKVGVLGPEDAYRLLTSRRLLLKEEERETAKAIAKALGYHALAIDVAGGALKRKGIAPFKNDLDDPRRDILELAGQLSGELPNGHERSISATFLKSIELLDEPGLDYLRLASVLAAAPIPALLVTAVFAAVDDLDEVSAQDRADLAMHEVAELSLAEDTGDEQGSQVVHTLISRTLRFHETLPTRREQLSKAAVKALNRTLPEVSDIRTHRTLEHWVTHGRELAADPQDVETAELLGWVARYDYERGNYRAAEQAKRKQYQIYRVLQGEEHPDTLRSMNDLAEVLRAQGELAGARALHEQVLLLYRRVLGEEHPNILQSMNNLAATLLAQGDLAGARALLEQVLAIRQRVLGEEHPDTLRSMNDLAEVLRAQGELAGARALHEQVLLLYRRVLGEEHPNILTLMNNLAGTLLAQGDLAGARTLLEQVLAIRQRVLGEEHPDTLRSMNDLAEVFRAQGDLAGARALLEQVLVLYRRVLGEEHPHTFTSLNNLALTFLAQGDLAGARALLEQVLAFYRRVLGEEHPDTLQLMNNLAEVFRAQGELAGARALHEQVLALYRRALGEEHPGTLTSMSNLAVTLQTQGDLVRARALHEQVLAIRRQVLGENHPDTSISAWMLLATLVQLGDFAAAKDILEKDLRWLLDRGPAELGDTQRQIREMLIKSLRNSGAERRAGFLALIRNRIRDLFRH